MSIRFQPAFRYDLRNMMRGAGIYLLAMALIKVFFAVLTVQISGQGSFSGIGFSSAAFALVMGIACVREDLRLLTQHGVTRRTAFLAELAALAVMAAGLAAAGALFIAAEGPGATDLYRLIYMETGLAGTLTIGQRAESFLINFGLMLLLGMLGQFGSLLFWRLNKFWTVVVAVGAPVLINLVPLTLAWLGLGDDAVRTMQVFFGFLERSVANLLLVTAAVIGVLIALNWLLLRRLNIKGAK